jgi:cytochrome c biogenesis protein CcmG/thiol:disulfide interchange protein DsbE
MSSGENIPKSPKRGNLLIAALPLMVFLVLAAIFLKQLAAGGANSDLPSALIGRPAPQTDLAPLPGLNVDGKPVPGMSNGMFVGKFTIVNVWASWCAPCRQEHPLLVELGKNADIRIVGLNYKDSPQNALGFLGQLGNPYDAVGMDPNGRAAIEWGVYGVPETFIVSPDGKILHKHVGPLSPDAIEQSILPLVDGS